MSATIQSAQTVATAPLVSVIFPLYNHAKYIEECLDSIRDEDWPRLELVVLDDGSKDDSFALAQSWVAKNSARFERIWLETQVNQGVCKTLNRLIQATHGDFLALMASDDAMLRGGIRQRVEHLQKNPKHLAVFGTVELMGDDVRSLGRIAQNQKQLVKAWRQPNLLVRGLLLNWGLAGPILLCHRSAFATEKGVGGYDESLAHDDLDMYLRLLSRDALGFIDQPVGKYRVHFNSFCRDKNQPPPRDESYRVWAKYLNQFSGLNRWLVQLQIWKSERSLVSHPQLHHRFARPAISLWRRWHRLKLFFSLI